MCIRGCTGENAPKKFLPILMKLGDLVGMAFIKICQNFVQNLTFFMIYLRIRDLD
jgi:hypothetical protein